MGPVFMDFDDIAGRISEGIEKGQDLLSTNFMDNRTHHCYPDEHFTNPEEKSDHTPALNRLDDADRSNEP